MEHPQYSTKSVRKEIFLDYSNIKSITINVIIIQNDIRNKFPEDPKAINKGDDFRWYNKVGDTSPRLRGLW